MPQGRSGSSSTSTELLGAVERPCGPGSCPPITWSRQMTAADSLFLHEASAIAYDRAGNASTRHPLRPIRTIPILLAAPTWTGEGALAVRRSWIVQRPIRRVRPAVTKRENYAFGSPSSRGRGSCAHARVLHAHEPLSVESGSQRAAQRPRAQLVLRPLLESPHCAVRGSGRGLRTQIRIGSPQAGGGSPDAHAAYAAPPPPTPPPPRARTGSAEAAPQGGSHLECDMGGGEEAEWLGESDS